MKRKEHVWIDGVEQKECGRCKEIKSLEEFSKMKKNWDNLNNVCKLCQKEYRNNNKERLNQKDREYWAKNKDKLNEQRKERYINEKEYILELNRLQRIKHKDKILANKKKYYWENREKDLESSKKWREENKEYKALYDKLYYEENKDKIVQYKKWWSKENRERINKGKRVRYKTNEKSRTAIKISNHKRESLKKNILSTLTNEEWIACQNHFKDEFGSLRCAYCNSITDSATVEHFIPLKENGNLTKENILPICLSCNCSKQDEDFFDWYPKQIFYSKEQELKILEYLGYNNHKQLSIL